MGRATSKLELKNINKQDIVIDEFELSERVKEAKIALQQYQDFMSEKVDVNYENDIWIFLDLTSYSKVKFNFQKINELLKFNHTVNNKILNDSIKCWITKELSEKSLFVAYDKFTKILSAVNISNGFDTAFNNKLVESLSQLTFYKISGQNMNDKTEMKEYMVITCICCITSFLTFYDCNGFSSLIARLNDLKSKYKYEMENRDLPNFKDILKFKLYLDDWIKSALEKNKKEEVLKFYPIVILWELTMIIPMRTTEFSKIKRNCLLSKEGKLFITFPRFKYHRKGEHRTKITYDTLPIPKELYQTIEHYISLTSRGEDTEYLIDYRIYSTYSREAAMLSNRYDRDRSIANANLAALIIKFYNEVINLENKVNFLFENKVNSKYKNESFVVHDIPLDTIQSILRPGDIRHLAIINMMMQGYDKVEIERVAGHFTESSQFNYYSHMENWMDVEISKIGREMAKINFTNDCCDENKLVVIHPKVNDFLDSLYKQSYVNKGRDKDFSKYIKLGLGHCKDETMPCPTFNWKHSGCYFCAHWTISQSELEMNRKIISEDVNLFYEELKCKVNFMKALLNAHLDEFGNVYANTKKDLSSTASEIRIGINNIAKLKVMLGVENYE